MKLAIAVALAIAAAAAPARGETIGVVVMGDPALSDAVTDRTETYLREHQRKTAADPLEPDAVSALTSCLLLDDDACARGVVEERSHTNTTLVVAIDPSGRDLTITGRWFVKGNDTHAERASCRDCKRDSWHGALDGILAALVPTTPPETGHLVLTSRPSGFVVVIDTTRVGKTPLEHDLVVGDHEVELRHGMHPVANRTVTITADAVARVDIAVAPSAPAPQPSHTTADIAIGLGSLAVGAGGWFLYYGLVGGRNERLVYSYYEQAPLIGGVLASAGAATLVAGIVLYTRGARATPVVAVVPGGGVFGWTGRF